jgi:hypothetical protein
MFLQEVAACVEVKPENHRTLVSRHLGSPGTSRFLQFFARVVKTSDMRVSTTFFTPLWHHNTRPKCPIAAISRRIHTSACQLGSSSVHIFHNPRQQTPGDWVELRFFTNADCHSAASSPPQNAALSLKSLLAHSDLSDSGVASLAHKLHSPQRCSRTRNSS